MTVQTIAVELPEMTATTELLAGPSNNTHAANRPLTDRERTARRLLHGAERHSFDPVTDIDWSSPPAPDLYYMPPELSSLYGTSLWDGMDEQRRIELTKHEVASIASVGIWFELVLTQMLVRHVYDLDPRTAHVQFGLTEIADECRHSTMFARMIDACEAPAYGPGRRGHALGKLFAHTARGPLIFAAALYVEEVLDALQRRAMRDARVQPLVRRVSEIHVVEESRHVRYAQTELQARWPKLSGPERAYARLVLARTVDVATRRLIHPQVYATVGLDPADARRAAEANPTWRATRAWAASRAVKIFTELGMIGGPGQLLWRRLGLLEPVAEPPSG